MQGALYCFVIGNENIRIRQQHIRILTGQISGIYGHDGIRVLLAVTADIQHELGPHHAEMHIAGMMKHLFVQHIKRQPVNAAAVTAETALAVFLHLDETGGRCLAGEGEQLGVGEILPCQKCLYKMAGIIIAQSGDNAGNAVKTLVRGTGNGRHATAGDLQLAGRDALIAGGRCLHQHQNIFCAGADKQAVQLFHMQ